MRLKFARTVSSIIAVVLGVVVALGWARHKEAIQTVGVDAAPQVIAAHDIKTWIEQLDAALDRCWIRRARWARSCRTSSATASRSAST
jgi:hypothetical protein